MESRRGRKMGEGMKQEGGRRKKDKKRRTGTEKGERLPSVKPAAGLGMVLGTSHT